MAAHSSILAWRIPWTEKPGGLQSDYVSLVNFGASVVVQMVKNLPAMQETWVWSLSWEDSLEEGITTYWYSCLENAMDRGARRAIVHGVTKSQKWLSDYAQHRFLTHIKSSSLSVCRFVLIADFWNVITNHMHVITKDFFKCSITVYAGNILSFLEPDRVKGEVMPMSRLAWWWLW